MDLLLLMYIIIFLEHLLGRLGHVLLLFFCKNWLHIHSLALDRHLDVHGWILDFVVVGRGAISDLGEFSASSIAYHAVILQYLNHIVASLLNEDEAAQEEAPKPSR